MEKNARHYVFQEEHLDKHLHNLTDTNIPVIIEIKLAQETMKKQHSMLLPDLSLQAVEKHLREPTLSPAVLCVPLVRVRSPGPNSARSLRFSTAC